jgi:hypothetical protein
MALQGGDRFMYLLDMVMKVFCFVLLIFFINMCAL